MIVSPMPDAPRIVFYNSLTKQVEAFTPKNPGKVRIYNCGPTVYKRQHIGNMRRYLFADFLRRTLEFLGYEVREITNITDVGHLTQDEIEAGEDKLEKEARAQKKTPQDIAEEQITFFLEDLKALNIQPAHKYPRATEHVEQMQALIAKLIERGHAYQIESGVYFDVTSFPGYGKLSGNSLTQIEAGARVEVREDKKHPADFALWKTDDPGHLQQWDSPWGRGYPGWHIECSAMSLEYLGPEIDIHTGGEDNRFPHHENEIAQSESVLTVPFVRMWMHNAFLRLRGEKLAKRAGEQITLDTLREEGYSPLAFRLFVFGSHYRKPLDFSWEALAAAAENFKSLEQLIRRLLELKAAESPPSARGDVIERFSEALADDLNTPQALAVIMDYVHEVNSQLPDKAGEALATLMKLDAVVGIFESLQQEIEGETIPEAVKQLAEERDQARAEKRFDEADALRLKIEEQGYIVEDTDSGARLRKAY